MNDTWWVDPSQLDDDQKRVVQLRPDKSLLVVGPPGSGKTNLLLLRARYIARSGSPNIQIIVFTRTLQEFLCLGGAAYKVESDHIKTLTAWAMKFLASYGITPETKANFQAQRKSLILQIKQLIQDKRLESVYDLILLDEAQDYNEEEVEVFATLARNIFAVADTRQQIYKSGNSLKALENHVDEIHALNFHYRNGFNICRLAEEVLIDASFPRYMSSASNYDEDETPSSVAAIRCTSFEEQCDNCHGRAERAPFGAS